MICGAILPKWQTTTIVCPRLDCMLRQRENAIPNLVGIPKENRLAAKG
jgi:hypothetical protein